MDVCSLTGSPEILNVVFVVVCLVWDNLKAYLSDILHSAFSSLVSRLSFIIFIWLSSFRFIFVLFYICGRFPRWMYVCAPLACLVPTEVRRSHQIPGTGVRDDCKPPRVCWESTWVLGESNNYLGSASPLLKCVYYMYLCVCGRIWTCGRWRTTISRYFHTIGTGDWTWVVRLGSKHLYTEPSHQPHHSVLYKVVKISTVIV